MKLHDALISFTDSYDLPCIIIDNSGLYKKYPSIRYVIGLIPHSDLLKNMYYINGCVQLDLNSEDSFAIIYTKFLEDEV